MLFLTTEKRTKKKENVSSSCLSFLSAICGAHVHSRKLREKTLGTKNVLAQKIARSTALVLLFPILSFGIFCPGDFTNSILKSRSRCAFPAESQAEHILSCSDHQWFQMVFLLMEGNSVLDYPICSDMCLMISISVFPKFGLSSDYAAAEIILDVVCPAVVPFE